MTFILLIVVIITLVIVFDRLRAIDRRIDLLRDYVLGKAKKEDLEQRIQSPQTSRFDVSIKNEPLPSRFDVSIKKEPIVTEKIESVAEVPKTKKVSKAERRKEPDLIQRLFGGMATEEWESVVGGSWLNKIGALVLIIGVALFLGYSFRYFGPLGRIIIGLVISLVLLGIGILTESKKRYAIFARGLLGAGWAGLYITTYAMHAMDASRIIYDPLIASVMLFVVAVGMILHSFIYRSEIVSGLAFFIGFITLAVTPLTGFSSIALFVLAFSLIVVAYKLSWNKMAVFGLVATYAIYAFKTSGLEMPRELSFVQFLFQHSILIIYWVLFEAFDLIAIKKRSSRLDLSMTIFPLNACGFLGVSFLQWSTGSNLIISHLLFMTAAAYLVSTIIRFRLMPPSASSKKDDIVTRLVGGGYEGAVTLAAALLVPFIYIRFSGLNINIALMLEAQFLFLLGLYFRLPYLRYLSLALFIIPLGKLLVYDINQPGEIILSGLNLKYWTPLAFLSAAVFSLNRFILNSIKGLKTVLAERGYSYSAAIVIAVVLGFELHSHLLALGLLLYAITLFENGIKTNLEEFRIQAYCVAVLALFTLVFINVFDLSVSNFASRLSLGLTAALAYLSFFRFYKFAPSNISKDESVNLRDISSGLGTILLAILCWYLLPVPLIAIGWGVLALLVLELGFFVNLPALRIQGNIMAALSFGRLFLANFTGIGETFGISHRVITVLPLALLFGYFSKKYRSVAEKLDFELYLNRIYLWAPAILFFFLIRFEFGRVLAVVGWSLLVLVFVLLGTRRNNIDLRWQGYILALIVFLRSWVTNFNMPESLSGMFGRVVTGSIVIAIFYACQFILPRYKDELEKYGRMMFSVLATVLLTVLIFYEVQGGWLTVAWGIEAVALLSVGFPTREKSLRLSGLFLLMLCIIKLFVFDLSGLETIHRILSFIVLGLLLLGVSLIYTRFSKQIKSYLVED